MNFCLITSFYPPYHPGGCGLHVYHQANLLAAAGHRVTVLCSDSAHLAKISAPRPGDYPHHPGVKVHRLKTPGGRSEVFLTYLLGKPVFSRLALRRALDGDFDVTHYHNISLLGGLGVLAWGRGIKVFTQHTYWLICPTHYLWRNKREICREKTCLRCLLAYKRPPQLWRYASRRERLLAGVNSLIMPCRFMIEQHRAEDMRQRMDHLPYFVEEVRPAAGGNEEEWSRLKPFFLVVARLETYKGVADAVEVFLERNSVANLVVVGTGSQARRLRQRSAACSRIHFLDYVAPDRLSWLYRNATALLAPSLWPEMGNQTVLQAFSCGTPVIASDRGCLPELIEAGVSGIIYHDRSGLATALDRLEDGSARAAFSAPAIKVYRDKYTPEVFLRNYLKIIAELMEKCSESQKKISRG